MAHLTSLTPIGNVEFLLTRHSRAHTAFPARVPDERIDDFGIQDVIECCVELLSHRRDQIGDRSVAHRRFLLLDLILIGGVRDLVPSGKLTDSSVRKLFEVPCTDVIK